MFSQDVSILFKVTPFFLHLEISYIFQLRLSKFKPSCCCARICYDKCTLGFLFCFVDFCFVGIERTDCMALKVISFLSCKNVFDLKTYFIRLNYSLRMRLINIFLFSNFLLSETSSSNNPFVVLRDFLHDYVVLQYLNFSGTKLAK